MKIEINIDWGEADLDDPRNYMPMPFQSYRTRTGVATVCINDEATYKVNLIRGMRERGGELCVEVLIGAGFYDMETTKKESIDRFVNKTIRDHIKEIISWQMKHGR